MAAHRFFQLDVFTERPLAGNALAVFPDGRGLDDRTMQRIAREMNLSETTFVLPSEHATRRVRFFTPRAEIPLAGHPTIGTWWLLAERREISLAPGGITGITQETGAGILPVTIASENGRLHCITMTQKQPSFLAEVSDIAGLASALGTSPDALIQDPLPRVVDTAMPQLIVPFRTVDGVKDLPSGGNGPALSAFLNAIGTQCAMCFAIDGPTVRCRMFAPGIGVPEDPATGSAAGALGAYLARHHLLPHANGVLEFRAHQGLEIDRPSEIDVRVAETDNGAYDVQVGGRAVTVIEGELRL